MASRTTAKKAAAAVTMPAARKSSVMVSNVLFDQELNQMKFDMSGIDVCYVNALRRVILSDVPCAVLSTVQFIENTSRMNNEIIKQRLSCVPIHLPYADSDKALIEANSGRYQVRLQVSNDTDQVIVVTTGNFTVERVEGDKPVEAPWQPQTMFPAHPITNAHIALLRLRPSTMLQQEVDGERIHLVAPISVSTARQNSCFNVAHTCFFRKKQIQGQALDDAREAFRQELNGQNMQKEEIEAAIEDWNLLDAQRKTEPDAFEFTLESLGQMPPLYIVNRAITLVYSTLSMLQEDIFAEKAKAVDAEGQKLITEPTNTMPLCYDVRLPRVENMLYPDYTIGKILESVIHSHYRVPHDKVLFCAFVKKHPHLELCYLTIALAPQSGEPDYEEVVLDILRTACKISIKVLEDLAQGVKDAM
jgi:DNA-directed RNA polymerase subunit L